MPFRIRGRSSARTEVLKEGNGTINTKHAVTTATATTKTSTSPPSPSDRSLRRSFLHRLFRVGRNSQSSKRTENDNPHTSEPPGTSKIPIRSPRASSSSISTTPDTKKPKPARNPTLTHRELRETFLGAPQFSVAVVDALAQPRVEFPWKIDKGKQPAGQQSKVHPSYEDSVPFSHPAFLSASLHSFANESHDSERPLPIKALEVPDMLSSQGREPGSVGFAHFLEIPVSDSLISHEQRDDEELREIQRNCHMLDLDCERLGIRIANVHVLAKRLTDLTDVYLATKDDLTRTVLDHYSVTELYSGVFGSILTPPKFDATTEDPTGLKVQVDTISRVLGLRGFWKDFSVVEWRIRIGQLLWPSADPTRNPEDDALLDYGAIHRERTILLLQIAIASELLLRLEAIARMNEEQLAKICLRPDEVDHLLRPRTCKVEYDMILARLFLDNITVTPPNFVPEAPPKKKGFFFWRKASPQVENDEQIRLKPRHVDRQLAGLCHFARKIDWPNIDMLEMHLKAKFRRDEKGLQPPESPSLYLTPSTTPRSGAVSPRSSYFGATSSRPALSRGSSMNRSVTLRPASSPTAGTPGTGSSASSSRRLSCGDDFSGAANVGGWLSQTYFSSLILPGEALSHFLIATLLENDSMAIGALGDAANLYGGFAYCGKSWWSLASVVGRVLACTPGANESMGWVGLCRMPDTVQNGWMEIASESLSTPASFARIKSPQDVAEDSKPFPLEAFGIRGTDFRRPWEHLQNKLGPDDIYLTRFSVDMLDDDVSVDGVSDMEQRQAEAKPYHASLSFSKLGGSELTLSLLKDVFFISSFPCNRPEQGLVQKFRWDVEDSVDAVEPQLQPHPLHSSYAYEMRAASELFANTNLMAEQSTSTLVLTVQAGSNSELLARAWCAQTGQHALIARCTKTCLSCSIREAKALDVRVVLWINALGGAQVEAAD